MKNKLLYQNVLKNLLYSLSLMLLCANFSWGQVQTIGSFPYVDGGFEGQTAGPIGIWDTASATPSTVWSRQTGSGNSAILNDGGARTGAKYAKGDDTGTTYTRVLQSPTGGADSSKWPLYLNSFVVQFWIKSSTLTAIPVGIGTTGNNYQNAFPTITTGSATWTKYTQICTSTANSEVLSIVGIGRVKVPGSFYVDDVVVYDGTTVDVDAPLAASSGTVSGSSVSWNASANVDGGGYMVVRYATNPNTDQDPNANGIYAVGNTITNGTNGLVNSGKVVYIGTGTSFTDTVAGAGATDYYKIYAVDKAFNYSSETIATAVVSNNPTITASTEILTGFSYTGVGPSTSQSFVVSGTKLTNSLVVTASTDFELSQDNFATAGVSSITLSGATVAATTLYVRLKSNLTVGAKSGTVSIASTGANTLPNISLSGSVTKVFYYKGSGALSSASSWGANANGSGANPTAVTDTYTNFVIANGNATTDAIWTLGSNSKVIVGTGSAVSLTVANGFYIVGPIDAVANGSVLWQDATASIYPSFGNLDSASEVHLQPATVATYAIGIGTTSYGKLFIDGAGKVSILAGTANSTATVKTSLTVASGSTLEFPVTNTHSITINTGASCTLNGTVRVGKQGGLLGSTTDTTPATTTTVSILFVGTPNLTLGSSSTIEYYRPDLTQTVSVLPSGVNYANLTLSETANDPTKPCVKYIPGPITVSGGVLTLNLPDATASTNGGCNITLVNGATKNIIAGTFDCDPTLGTADFGKADNTIAFYPNPAQEVLNVNSDHSIAKIEVYDLQGKKVASNHNAKNVNVAALGKGVYIVKVVQDNGSVVAKQFIKK